MNDETEITEAFVDLDQPEIESVPEPGPDPRNIQLSENRLPAFYRVHYETPAGAVQRIFRLADSEKRACDLVIFSFDPPVRIVRLAKFSTRQELLDNLPVGRAIRDVLPAADLVLAHSLGLLIERDICP